MFVCRYIICLPKGIERLQKSCTKCIATGIAYWCQVSCGTWLCIRPYCVAIQDTEKVYFKSQILIHEYWTILDHFCIPVIVSFWITPAHSKERKYHIFGQYWYTKNVPVFTNTRTFQYLGPEVYFSPRYFHKQFNFQHFYNFKSSWFTLDCCLFPYMKIQQFLEFSTCRYCYRNSERC